MFTLRGERMRAYATLAANVSELCTRAEMSAGPRRYRTTEDGRLVGDEPWSKWASRELGPMTHQMFRSLSEVEIIGSQKVPAAPVKQFMMHLKFLAKTAESTSKGREIVKEASAARTSLVQLQTAMADDLGITIASHPENIASLSVDT